MKMRMDAGVDLDIEDDMEVTITGEAVQVRAAPPPAQEEPPADTLFDVAPLELWKPAYEIHPDHQQHLCVHGTWYPGHNVSEPQMKKIDGMVLAIKAMAHFARERGNEERYDVALDRCMSLLDAAKKNNDAPSIPLIDRDDMSGENARKIIDAFGMSQKDVGELVGLNSGSLAGMVRSNATYSTSGVRTNWYKLYDAAVAAGVFIEVDEVAA